MRAVATPDVRALERLHQRAVRSGQAQVGDSVSLHGPFAVAGLRRTTGCMACRHACASSTLPWASLAPACTAALGLLSFGTELSRL